LAAFHAGQVPIPLPHTQASPVAVTNPAPVRLPLQPPPSATPGPRLETARVSPEDPASPQVQQPVAPPQPDAPGPKSVFEVASVKQSAPDYRIVTARGGPGTADPTRYTIENYPMSSLLEVAYGISSYQLSGPGWLNPERFTVNAKLPEGATKEQLGP